MTKNHYRHHRHRRRPSRGIKNVSNVSCHLACAVQIVVNAIPPIRRTLENMSCLSSLPLQEIAERVATTTTTTTNTGDDGNSIDPTLTGIIQELLDFMTSSDSTEGTPSIDHDAWDPSKLYRYLRQVDDTIDAYNVGDSSSSLSKLLRVLSKVSSSWNELLKLSVWNGQTRQLLIGTKRLSEKKSIRRIKQQSKAKQMTCPLVIKVPPPSSCSCSCSRSRSSETSFVSLHDCITAMFEPQIVRGEYPWDSQSPEAYTERQLDDNYSRMEKEDCCSECVSSYDTWTTTKQVQFEEIPRVWLLHLERPDWRRQQQQQQQQQHVDMKNVGDDNSFDGEKSKEFIKINVPIQLDLTNFATSDDKKLSQSSKTKTSLTLTGAIIQVRYLDDDEDLGDVDHCTAYPNDHANDDEGHCFTILRNNKDDDDDDDNDKNDRSSTASSNWMKLDDGKQVSMISEERALDLIGGCITKTSAEGRRRTFSFASLLVYSRESHHHNDDNDDDDDDWNQCIDSISEFWKIVLDKNDEVHRKEMASVGRRLKVKWAKEKYYSGTVTSYDPMTGKHQVTYDDGDIRTYCLAKKTILWIEED